MTRLSGASSFGTFLKSTPLNAVTESDTSNPINIGGAKRVTFAFTRADHSSGSSVFKVQGSLDGSTWVDLNLLIDNVTNTNAQTKTRVGSVSLSSDTTKVYALDLDHFGFPLIRVDVVETTDGTHTAECFQEF